MQYLTTYSSPLGNILLACDHIGLTGLWFEDQKHFKANLSPEHIYIESSSTLPSALSESIHWLDVYFSGVNPDFTPQLHLIGTTFRMEVWKILLDIPYGKTVTYGEIASKLAKQRGLSSMSAQAVGGAVGHNPISIIVPCHRVIGSNRSLTGYAGGITRKSYLLSMETYAHSV